MTDVTPAAAATSAAATTGSGQTLSLPGWNQPALGERERLIGQARGTDATRQVQRCFPRWSQALEHLTSRALARLAANEPLDVNDPDMWASRDEQAQAVLRRHGLTTVRASRLTMAAVNALIEGQAAADRDAGLDWSTLIVPASRLDERLRRAQARLPIDLIDPSVYVHRTDQRRVLAARLGLAGEKADDLSRWALAHPDEFDPEELRCWRIGSPTWLELADEQLATVERVQRPVGLFVAPAIRTEGWQLTPVLSLEAIRMFTMLGGYVERDLCAVALPFDKVPALLERINLQTLHAGPEERIDSAGQLASELSTRLGRRVSPGVPHDKRDRWGRLLVSRTGYKGDVGTRFELRLRVVTFPTRDFTQRRLGARRMSETYNAQASAAMDLGEAVQTAVERGLPLLLSTEAAGHLKDNIRVGRMKGRPGMLTITTSDGLSATTRRLVAEQAIPELRVLKHAEAKVTLDAGARQVIRMALAKPLDDDPVLLGRQREIAALKVVGSGVDASQTGAGKCCDGDTRVLVNGQLVTIKHVWERYAEHIEFDGAGFWASPTEPLRTNALSADGRMTSANISALYRQRVQEPGRRVNLSDGSEITITRAHRLHGSDEWTRAISVGDVVCVPSRIEHHGDPLSPALGEVIAWQLAEGHETSYVSGPGAGARNRRDSARITQADISVLERLRALVAAIATEENLRVGSMAILQRAGRASVLTINSCDWRRFLEKLGYPWGRVSAQKEIPATIMSADDRTLGVFLRAYFDAEGSVNVARRFVEVTSASRRLIVELATMLRRFGVWLRIKHERKRATNGAGVWRDYWTGYISGPSLRRYRDCIGFGDMRKQNQLTQAGTARSNANVEVVPVADVLAELRLAGIPGKWVPPRGFESYAGEAMSPSLTKRAAASNTLYIGTPRSAGPDRQSARSG